MTVQSRSGSLRAVVTGASSGIGEAAVRRLRAEGWQVAALARRGDRLERLAVETGAVAYTADLTDADATAAAVAAILADGPVHALINNAGGAFGLEPVAESDLGLWQRMYDINVLGATRITQGLLPGLLETGRGDVVFITSVAAHGAYPGGAGYVGVKHAERMVAQTLREELAGQPVRIIEIAPGAVNTEEFSLNRFDGDAERAARVYEGFDPLTADDIADAVAWTITRPHHVNVDTLIIRPRAQVGARTPSKPAK